MATATITISDNEDGSVEVKALYPGGYDYSLNSHVTVAQLLEKMHELGKPVDEQISLTQAQVDAMEHNALLTHKGAAQLLGAPAQPMFKAVADYQGTPPDEIGTRYSGSVKQEVAEGFAKLMGRESSPADAG